MNFEGTVLDDALSQSLSLLPVGQTNLLKSSNAQKSQVRRPHNAYNLYFIERLPIEKEENPNLTGNEISHLIGKKWAAMSEEEKKPYRDRAQEIKAKFKQENPDYHYQKGGTKAKGRKDLFMQAFPENLTLEQRIEVQMKSLLAFLGAQAITHYLGNNKGLEDINAITRNVTRMVGNGQNIEEPLVDAVQ